MQFTSQTITIFTPEYQPYEMEAMVGEGSSLAYYETSRGYPNRP